MVKFIINLLLITLTIFSQTDSINFQSPDNIKKFANYLFCEGDYLRAAEEFEKISEISDDTINFKVMLCYSELNVYSKAITSFSEKKFSRLSTEAKKLYMKNWFMNNPYDFSLPLSDNYLPIEMDSEAGNYFLKLNSIYYLGIRTDTLSKEALLSPFNDLQKKDLENFYNLSVNPPYKSSALAGIFSALIPGSGKMYVGEWDGGITALLVTSLFAFLAYDNFKADHQTRAWIFTGLSAFFYGGNIYGSIASAQIFNARIDFEFNDGLKLYLEQENYFLPEYDFCN